MAWAAVQNAKGTSSTSGTTFGVAFTTANITSGNRIRVSASIWDNVATTVTSVTDSAGNTYTLDKRVSVSDNTDITLWSAPITAGGGTKPTVTLHASGTTSEWALEIFEDSGLLGGTSGYLDGTAGAATSAAGATVSSGASSPAPGASNEMAVGVYGDGGNNTTITVGSGWSGFLFTGASSATSEAASETQNSTSGTGSNATFGVSPTGSPAGALVAVYKLAAAAASGPLSARTKLRPTSSTPRGRVRVAGPAPPAAPSVLGRERLVRTVSTPRGNARRAAAAGPAAAPTTIRERLVSMVPPLRGRGRVAGAAPPAQRPTTARQRLVAAPPVVRSRAVPIAKVIVGLLHPTARTRLVVTALIARARAAVARPAGPGQPPLRARGRAAMVATPRGRARVAGASGPAARPLAARGLARGPIRLVRGALARLITAFTGPPPPTIAITIVSRNGVGALTSHGNATAVTRAAAASLSSRNAAAQVESRDGSATLTTH